MSKRIPEEVIDDVRSQVNILDIVEQFVQMHRSGKNWFGLCPFHTEKTPSFSVNEQKQIFNCFSCHRGGNVFKFIMELENISFPESVIRVAELGNITISQEYITDIHSGGFGNDSSESNPEKTAIKNYYHEAAELYHHILVSTEIGGRALEYLHERGLTDELIDEFGLGYAPEKKLLLPFFDEHQPNYQQLRKTGLFVEKHDGQLSDRFIDRIMFPIRNAGGQVIAFSGRLLNKNASAPKYLNSPETEIFNKRNVLFNFDKAKNVVHSEKNIILFEGFMDVLAAYRAGITNGVASMGTSLTEQQIYMLARVSKNISICYDGDEPGQNATKRALELLRSIGKFKLSVIALPEKLDPDEYVKKYGERKFFERAKKGKEGELAFYLRFYEQGRNLDNEQDQLGYIDDILRQLARTDDPIERDLYSNRLIQRFNLDKNTLESQIKGLRASFKERAGGQKKRNIQKQERPLIESSTQAPIHYSRIEKAERLLLYRILHDHSTWLKIANIPDFSFVHESYQTLYLLAQGFFNQHKKYDSAAFLDFVQESGLQDIIVGLEMNNFNEQASDQELNDCLKLILEASPLEQKIHATNSKLARAKRMNDQDAVVELTIKLIKLLQRKQAGISAI